MFFKRRWFKGKRRSEENEENKGKQEIFKEVEIEKKKMPIIILDNSWHQLMSDIKTSQISHLEKELTNLLKEQGKLNTDYIEYTKMKKEMLANILELTHQIFELKSEQAGQEIEDQQKMVMKINENLEIIEPRLDIIAEEIEETNSILVDESVSLCYSHINNYKGKSNELDEEIQDIRRVLMEKTEEKKRYDKKSEQLYRHLHQVVGANFIEKLDYVYWEKSE